MQRADPAQYLTTAGSDVDDLDVDLSDFIYPTCEASCGLQIGAHLGEGTNLFFIV